MVEVEMETRQMQVDLDELRQREIVPRAVPLAQPHPDAWMERNDDFVVAPKMVSGVPQDLRQDFDSYRNQKQLPQQQVQLKRFEGYNMNLQEQREYLALQKRSEETQAAQLAMKIDEQQREIQTAQWRRDFAAKEKKAAEDKYKLELQSGFGSIDTPAQKAQKKQFAEASREERELQMDF